MLKVRMVYVSIHSEQSLKDDFGCEYASLYFSSALSIRCQQVAQVFELINLLD